jgi:GNAT superfamily N-acetyltransferase
LDSVDVDTRIAGLDDADELADVGGASFRTAYGPHSSAQDLAAFVEEYFSPTAIRKELQKRDVTYLLATVNNLPAGLVKMRGGNVPDAIPAANVREIQQFYISPSSQRMGVGAVLMVAALQYAATNSIAGVWLTAWDEADWAINFYLKHGFSQVGNIDFTVGSTVYNDFLMWRPVGELEDKHG